MGLKQVRHGNCWQAIVMPCTTVWKPCTALLCNSTNAFDHRHAIRRRSVKQAKQAGMLLSTQQCSLQCHFYDWHIHMANPFLLTMMYRKTCSCVCYHQLYISTCSHAARQIRHCPPWCIGLWQTASRCQPRAFDPTAQRFAGS